MNKKVLIGAGIALAIVVIAVVLGIIFEAAPMLSQPKENVVSIVVHYSPDAAETREYQPAQRADMLSTYSAVADCEKRRNINAGKQDMTFTPYFEMIITYRDGKQDRIFSGATPEDVPTIYRCLNPNAPTEEQKFVSAKCPALTNYIKNYF